jgi:hypothetical protein
VSLRTSFAISQPERIPSESVMWIGGLLGASVLWFLMLHGQFNFLCAFILASGLILVSLFDKPAAILLTLAYLILMGDLRRMLSVVFGQPAQDLLLLVGPVVAFVLALPLFARLRLKDGLSRAMLALLAVMALEIFNPKQGGLTVGLSGAIFYIAPMLWFWLGRHFGSPIVVEKLLYFVIFPLSLVAALLGFVQTFVGFLPYEQAWIDVASKTYSALYVGGSIRPFGFSVSGTEYAVLLMLGAVGVAAAYFGRRRRWTLIFPVLLAGVVLASGRTAVIRVIITLAFVWTLRKGQRLNAAKLFTLLLFALVGLVGVVLIASRFAVPDAGSSGKNSVVNDALAHQAGGLAHPLDPRYSTASLHGGMFWSGILQGFTYPIGHGLGSTTDAATKFGGETDTDAGSSELDISDMFIALGLVGGLLYLYIVIRTMRQTLAYLRTVRLSISLPVAAILICTLGSWLIGGQYSTSALLFFLVGALLYPDPMQANDRTNSPRLTHQKI